MAIKFLGGIRHGQEVPVWAIDGRSQLLVDADSVMPSDAAHLEVSMHQYSLQSWCHPSGQLVPFYAADGMSEDEMNEAARELLGNDP